MTNQLRKETSPYLLQHADNPVDWHPWSESAFTLARESNKPVLLSIGYSACHWCHVMAHESFDDPETARVMNEHYVNIKVDREERPDIDRIYQVAHQLLTQRAGGWPLTMFLHPETQRPFFGGTYFPPVARDGMPAFKDLLSTVAKYFAENPNDITTQGEQIIDVFKRLDPPHASAVALSDAPLQAFHDKISASFDRDYGGMGSAPKFPQVPILNGLLRRWRASANSAEPNLDALFMVGLSLTRMAEGGIFDQIGGGFYRYSVDRQWEIPHFEKMLYDNGPLLALYADAFLATGDPVYAKAANDTADWLLDDMLAPNGGFYSSRDADSDGGEGKFYVWTPEAVRNVLDADAYAAFAARYGLDGEANFEGAWHLHVVQDLKSIASEQSVSVRKLKKTLDAARKTLAAERAKRPAPIRDEKQLVSWNALAIRGAAIAGRALERDELIDAALDACNFIRSSMFVDGRLFATHSDGTSKLDAYLDDYAFMIDAILEVLQTRWSSDLLKFATELADTLLSQFMDTENGGFFFTANDHEKLMVRSKPLADEAMPSGNGIACLALQRLGFLTGNTAYLNASEQTLKAAQQAMTDYPHGHASLLDALEENLSPPEIIIIRGAETEARNWQASAAKVYAPSRLVFAIPADTEGLPDALSEKAAQHGETIAYRCIGMRCELPVSTFEALAASLSETAGGD